MKSLTIRHKKNSYMVNSNACKHCNCSKCLAYLCCKPCPSSPLYYKEVFSGIWSLSWPHNNSAAAIILKLTVTWEDELLYPWIVSVWTMLNHYCVFNVCVIWIHMNRWRRQCCMQREIVCQAQKGQNPKVKLLPYMSEGKMVRRADSPF